MNLLWELDLTILKLETCEQDILLLSNEHYRKSGNLNAVYYKIIKDPLSLVSEFKAQGLHMIEVPTEVKTLESTRARLFPVNQFNLYFIGMNMKSGRFADRKMRQAIAYAVNRENNREFAIWFGGCCDWSSS